MYIVAIIQARMGSTRLPGKVMLPINDNIPMIGALLFRLDKSKEIDKIVVATSVDPCNKPLIDYVEKKGYDVFQGSENNVLDRYYQASLKYKPDIVIRITADCPLIDSEIIDDVIKKYKSSNADYACNTIPPTYPDGLDVEVFSYSSLKTAWREAKTSYDREHVTSFIRNSGNFKIKNIASSVDYSGERWTVDESEDYKVVKSIFKYFYPRLDFSWNDVLSLTHSNPDIFLINKHLIRNEGANMNNGQKLYKRAKKIIPGGGMLLSKRPEMFLPEKWPSYYSKSKGCRVWDLDGREYIDMSIMSIGTNTLGYGNQEVDEAVIETVKNGNMSTLNCPEEVKLAEKLVDMHQWADMVRFARSGGEANSISIRIARAATGRDKVAICGYHGWHDWYLSTNLNSNKNLDGHLLPGLQPSGVPRGLMGTTLPFNYNDIEQLEKIIKDNNNEIAAIKMEVSRSEGPKNNFLQKVRDIATENNIILIFDECTSGFRETFGGLHKKFGVNPDLAVFAKALGNGYAISACIGRKEFMQAAQKTFISSTFWTERIGPAAALKTLEVMERTKSWVKITNTGLNIRGYWQDLAREYDLDLKVFGLPAVQSYAFDSEKNLEYKTLITQEMLKKGFLSTPLIFSSTAHSKSDVDLYISALRECFSLVKDCEDGMDINSILEGPVCHNGFVRLN
ncbi:aminotransferase class III-fold pyridoxal phosphate-dependent enzyme [bacterium]|jgi:glutamate-1-semialdehyde 2,1-aminomutase|nr:aminotransferase class III-fold pyridoxal phosphate-dependent enzyme [bacterium]